MVGLPARGKSWYVYKLEQFLSWRGYKTKSFKVGAWRRGELENSRNSNGQDVVSPSVARRGLAGLNYSPPPATNATTSADDNRGATRTQHSSASFFDSTKAYAMATREKVSLEVFSEVLAWLDDERGHVAIFDASNVTIARRAKLAEVMRKHVAKRSGSSPVSMVFVESICTDEEVVRRAMLNKVRLSNDFKGMPLEEAMEDLQSRIEHYEKTYQTVREAEGSYIKIFDMKAKVHACNIYGRMAKSVLPYLMALHPVNRPIMLLSIAESAEGDRSAAFDGSVLSVDGESNPLLPGGALPPALSSWLGANSHAHELHILSSTQPRALAHAQAIASAAGAAPPVHRAQLAPLRRERSPTQGDEDGLTFKSAFGERVADLVVRLEPIVLEMEGSTAPVLVVAHEGACRALRSFLLNTCKEITAREAVDVSFEVGAGVLLEYSFMQEGHSQLSETILSF